MLSIGIVGLPNVGKSTLFNALTNNNILAANYPFATIEPNTGIVPIPDARLLGLHELYDGAKIMPATVTFVDIAGLVAGASTGEGLGNKFLANIRQCQAICHVVRAFHGDDIVHVADTIEPRRDIETINTELILADLQTIDSRLPKLDKEARADSHLRPMVEAMQVARKVLDNGELLSSARAAISREVWEWLRKDLQLLTMKPTIYLFNVDEETLNNKSTQDNLRALVAPALSVFVCAKLEEELRGLDATEATELLESYGQSEPGLNQLISAAYDTLGLQSYLTAGPKEVRAWTIPKGATAPQAAGVIHGDFERGFIAAQIINYDDLIAAGSETAAKAAGKVRTEGKDYVMQPGDVVEFRFNV